MNVDYLLESDFLMQTLLKNLFNSMNYWEYLYSLYSLKYSLNHLLKVNQGIEK